MNAAPESKPALRRVLACAAVALLAAAPAAWAQNSQRPDEGTGAPPAAGMSNQGGSQDMTAPPDMSQRGAQPGMRSHSGSSGHVKPGAAGAGAGNGRSPGATGSGGGGAGGTGSAGSSGY
ncbi:hypothetical protein NUV26_33945 [Burkholderia pseudomultivorans]|uniref:Uncharacterized protein n=2 Tax=Burkholderia cepacia complex TaxID=87882 RepID=A0AAN0VJV5_9BURK|nr:hypothetical protein [Burkholderia pseudomultivorans]AIO30196.1 hypothetical protein DM39_7050 [Burkholderia cenocepacia]AOI90312.1 hypothetical protein WS57_15630 [Burkholderia pseudomultivorans]KVC24389.1 hypothetical protein WS55_18215 [Burkholderia pseudomultivorans]KVC34106.1 hypothetical protein WS56_12425 [Burkholderia pseudomultivorans]KVC48490.1 hypothetical protein WS58_08660 [Burkholderia pseudomultivorans]